MPELLLLGREPADKILARAKSTAEGLKRPPTLAIVHVGEDPAALAYVRSAVRTAKKAAVEVRTVPLPAGSGFDALESQIRRLSVDPAVHGIQVQNPVPGGKSLVDAVACMDPKKDVEGMHPASQGLLFQGKARYVPCTARAVLRLLEHYEVPLAGRRAVVLGRSLAVGRPAALLLLEANATVTVCHTKTRGLADEVARAEILVAAAGVPELVKADWVPRGCVVVDVGYHVLADGRTVGDVEAAAKERASAIAPVPGGVGPLTVAELLSAVVDAASTAGA